MAIVTADDVNFLVWRYLQESGFRHTAFTFTYESGVKQHKIDHNDLPQGALISLIQKGLQYMELEANLNEEGSEIEYDYSPLSTQELLSKTVDELKQMVRAKKKPIDAQSGRNSDSRGGRSRRSTRDHSEDMDEEAEDKNVDIVSLTGHHRDVYFCSWCPSSANIVATGAGDGTARIWSLPPTTKQHKSSPSSVELDHEMAGAKRDVTAISWSSDGSLLSTGTYHGAGYIWDREGKMHYRLEGHEGPVLALKWSPTKEYTLLSGGYDGNVVCWDASQGVEKRRERMHDGAVFDIDWCDASRFASGGMDGIVCISSMSSSDSSHQRKELRGHTNEINSVAWDPSGSFLASCSDDCTARIWVTERGDDFGDVSWHELAEHTMPVYDMAWAPLGLGKGTNLATASWDGTVKLWDAETGKCLTTVGKHTSAVYAVSYSPTSAMIASGSYDRHVRVWSAKDGSLIRSYEGGAGVYSVGWNKDGTKVAASFADDSAVVLNLAMRST